MLRKFSYLAGLVFLIVASGKSQSSWRIGIFDFSYNSVKSELVGIGIKASVVGLLKKSGFDVVDVKQPKNTTVLSNYIISLSDRHQFFVHGIINEDENENFTIVLNLYDVGNSMVKMTRVYKLKYNPDEMFETIDSIIQDFKENVTKVIPKYSESLYEEYQKKTVTKIREIKIPGYLIVSWLAESFFIFPQELVLSRFNINPLKMSVDYISTESGLFGKGWYTGLSVYEYFFSISSSSQNSPIDKDFPVYIGTKVSDWLGFGVLVNIIDIKWFFEVKIDDYVRTMKFGRQFIPKINFYLKPFSSVEMFVNLDLGLGVSDSYEQNIKDLSYLGIDVRGIYHISDDFALDFSLGVYNLTTYYLGMQRNMQFIVPIFSVGGGLSKKFKM